MDVCVSSWNRPAPNTLPQMAKCAANYMNSQLIRMEARANGYVEGIALDTNGYVSEGSGENIFVVMDGTVITPPLSNSALPGITRHSVITICRDLGIPVAEQIIPREMLYIANEIFFCGTAVEITPIRSIDRVKIGIGSRGPITKTHPGRILRPSRRQKARPPQLALPSRRPSRSHRSNPLKLSTARERHQVLMSRPLARHTYAGNLATVLWLRDYTILEWRSCSRSTSNS